MMLPNKVKVLIANEPVDFRKTFDGLCGVVREALDEDPLSPALFVFRNRRADQIRILWWDRNGFALWMKRLERGTFRFPVGAGSKRTISSVELAAILEDAVVMRRAA
jgi:transposase